jgi:hypothetical protein
VRITGSMTVERVAKPLKNSVLTTDRATLGTGKADMLLRAALNLLFCAMQKTCSKQQRLRGNKNDSNGEESTQHATVTVTVPKMRLHGNNK